MNELYRTFKEVFMMPYIFTRFTMYQFNFQQAMDSCFLNVVHALIYTGFLTRSTKFS